MPAQRRISICILAAAAALWLAALAAPLKAETLSPAWPWRRPLLFRQAPSDAPGENLAWAEFYTNGAQKPDGSDIRITTADRTVVPHKLLQVSRDNDFIRVVFATRGDGPYYACWGNPQAEPPGKEPVIKRGVYLEVFRNQGRPAQALNPSGPPLASFILPDLFIGYNPLGDNTNVTLHYSGNFRVDRPMTARFAFAVNDMAILSIDGNEVGRNNRGAGPPNQVRNPISLDLTAGWHAIDVVQVNQNQPNILVSVVWLPPGQTNYVPLPLAVFAPIAAATSGALEKLGATLVVDVSVTPEAEAFSPPGSYLQRYTLEAQYPPAMRPVLTWDFGDGQTLVGLKKAGHVFLAPGAYPVTLKLESGGITQTTTTRIAVRDRMYARFPRPPEDPPRVVQAVLHDYNPAKLSAEAALRGMFFFKQNNIADDYINWGKAWLAMREAGGVPDGVVFDETFDLSRLLVARKQFKDAAEVYRLASQKSLGMETRANLMRHGVMVRCDYVDDAEAAYTEAQNWVRRVSSSNRAQVAIVQAALAYAAIARGDGKAARAAVDAAKAAARTPPSNQADLRQGVLARNVENYLGTKDYDTALTALNQWELDYPEAIWEGFTRTLRVKLAAAEGRNLVAARMALAMAKANPDGFYAAELLFRASENFKLGGEQTQGRAALELLTSRYPESPYARGAGKSN